MLRHIPSYKVGGNYVSKTSIIHQKYNVDRSFLIYGTPSNSLMIYDIHINDDFQIDQKPKLLIKLDDFKNPEIKFSDQARGKGYETKTKYVI